MLKTAWDEIHILWNRTVTSFNKMRAITKQIVEFTPNLFILFVLNGRYERFQNKNHIIFLFLAAKALIAYHWKYLDNLAWKKRVGWDLFFCPAWEISDNIHQLKKQNGKSLLTGFYLFYKGQNYFHRNVWKI